MKYSVNIETVYTEMPFAERFAAAKRDGFDYVEIWDWTAKDLDELSALCRKNDVKISCMGGERPMSGNSSVSGSVLGRSLRRPGSDRARPTTLTSSLRSKGLGRYSKAPFSAADKAVLLRQLKVVGDQDYFERGIELAIEQNRLLIEPVDISDLYAVEVDFAEDLERANLFV
jgi:hypothetical protein